MKITKQDKLILLENIEGNTSWFNDKEYKIFKSIIETIRNKR